ncbi:Protein FAR-RED ELONGATED HYPOCOTYL 1 [Quillaja saponaria]|uniref:Protein FAR-RED ELONGATED HYPOCOTYL 1 n=1 Tax=Quillaja saponaria TaxID=32244 RepID=A0AAD7LNR6_QUISA|nr:Protein FAR-RED ELONGATED HYPOCOTYL 1 [Quillaja saponaria]
MSVNEEAKLGTESADAYECDRCSTSSVNWGGDHLKGPHYFLDGLTMEKTVYDKEEFSFMSGEHYPSHDDPDIQALQNVEEHLLGFGNPSEYGNGKIEQCLHEEFEEILCSKGVNPNMYVLSSGRWTVDEEAQSRTRKPTIDQEFEQHFSMLML